MKTLLLIVGLIVLMGVAGNHTDKPGIARDQKLVRDQVGNIVTEDDAAAYCEHTGLKLVAYEDGSTTCGKEKR